MPYAASHNLISNTKQALQAACREVQQKLHGTPPDVTFLFVTRDHAEQFEQLAQFVQETLQTAHLVGCTGESVAGTGQEIENGPAVSLWCAALPGARVQSFHVDFERTPDGLICLGFPEREDVPAAETPAAVESSADSTAAESTAADSTSADTPTVFLLGDPFTCAVDAFIDRLAEEWPGTHLLGGMASGGNSPGENRLYLNGQRIERGGVGIVIHGGPRIRSIVSQGCRPIGNTFIVTKATQNVIFELGGKPALERFQEMYSTMSGRDRALVQRGLHLGVVMNEYQARFDRGDFLICNVMGADQASGAIAVGNYVKTGQTVQFHVRDHATADEDLRQLLTMSLTNAGPAPLAPPQAALLFSCNGRGTRLFPEPNHDAGVIQELCGPVPLAGFFAQGELGPVSGRNHMHGFTASIALFDA